MGQSGHAAPEDRLRRAKTYARRGAAPASRGARGVLYRKFRQNGNRDCQPVLIHSTAMRNRVRFLPVLLLTFAAATAAPNLDRVANSITIYRDTYGVPHIYGPTDASCVFGYAYAQAEDNFWQIEDSYLRALGRASEVAGLVEGASAPASARALRAVVHAGVQPLRAILPVSLRRAEWHGFH